MFFSDVLRRPSNNSPLDIKAFRAARLETVLRGIAFSVFKRLCGRIGHLPDSYLLSDKFDLSGLPRASGGFADIRVGAFKGKNVAIKSLKVSEMDDKTKICKVGSRVAFFHLRSLTHHTALLYRSRHVEELVPSQRPRCPRCS